MSAKGLEWARQLRVELENRISGLREALAGIEPLRVELARLEEQQKGVERLIAAYETQLGFAKREHLVPRPAPQHAAPLAANDESPPPRLQAAGDLVHVQPPRPTLLAILRGEALAAIAFCRRSVARLWLSVRA